MKKAAGSSLSYWEMNEENITTQTETPENDGVFIFYIL
jgi:hypothetical protein